MSVCFRSSISCSMALSFGDWLRGCANRMPLDGVATCYPAKAV